MSLSVTPIRNRIAFRADNQASTPVSAPKNDDTPKKEPVVPAKKTEGDSFQKEGDNVKKNRHLRRRKEAGKQGAEGDVLDDTIKEALPQNDVPRHRRIKHNIKRAIGNSVEAWEDFLKFKARASAYASGIFNGVVAGLGVGGSIMALDWAMNGIARISRKETTSTMYIKEPAALVTDAFKKVFKGIYALPDKTIRQLTKEFIHSPITLFNYVRNAQNVSKIGKTVAPLAGGAAMAYYLVKAGLQANHRIAGIEHAFSSGHAHDLA